MGCLNDWAKGITIWRKVKGFYTPTHINFTDNRDLMLGKLMLVVTEVAEAAEALRAYDKDPAEARVNFEEEIADTIIRLLDICGSMEIDLDAVMAAKMEKNWNRPRLHGKSTSI